jgi:hypothetical protein
MSSLYFGLEIFCPYDPEFDAVYTSTAAPVFFFCGEVLCLIYKTLVSNRQKTEGLQDNDEIASLI